MSWKNICNKFALEGNLRDSEKKELRQNARMWKQKYDEPIDKICGDLETLKSTPAEFKQYILEKKADGCKNRDGMIQEFVDIPPKNFTIYNDDGDNFYCDDVVDLKTYLLNNRLNPFNKEIISSDERLRIYDDANRLLADILFPSLTVQLNIETQNAFRDFCNDYLNEENLDNFVRMAQKDFERYIFVLENRFQLISDLEQRNIIENDTLTQMKFRLCKIIQTKKYFMRKDEFNGFSTSLSSSLLNFEFCHEFLEDWEIDGISPRQFRSNEESRSSAAALESDELRQRARTAAARRIERENAIRQEAEIVRPPLHERWPTALSTQIEDDSWPWTFPEPLHQLREDEPRRTMPLLRAGERRRSAVYESDEEEERSEETMNYLL